MPKKESKLYYSISEVSKMTGLEQYVLRYWETEFPMLRPKKNRAGNRAYRQSDIQIIEEIKFLLYDKKFTIAGALQSLQSKDKDIPTPVVKVGAPEPDEDVLLDLKKGIDELLREIREARNS